MSEKPNPEAFEKLGLHAPLLRAIAQAGYQQPTPIQAQAIPPALAGRDIVGCAQTGTGKTAAFSLPLLQRIDAAAEDEPAIRALIVTPTRELAAQIGASIETYGKQLDDIWHTVIFGGVNEKKQIRDLQRGVDILVATPGRLLDLAGRGHISFKSIEIFVLDEADRMLDMGFLPDVKRIVAQLPKERQTLFFSATMPAEIEALAKSMLRDPVAVSVTPPSTVAERIEQRLYCVDKADKRKLLAHLIESEGGPSATQTLVFSRTKHGANRIAKYLDQQGIKAAAIHGNKSQNARTRALDGFRDGSTPVLVATDIAARGIDVEGVTHVINFDLPDVPETYVHRIGRTARAKASGIALSFCDAAEEGDNLVDIERLLGEHIERVEDHAFASKRPAALTDLNSRSKPRSSGGKGRGKGGGKKSGSRRGGGGRRGGGRSGSANRSSR